MPKLLCFALVKSWCESRDKRIKRGRAAKRNGIRGGRERATREFRLLDSGPGNDTVEGEGAEERERELEGLRREYYFYLPRDHHLFPRTYFREKPSRAKCHPRGNNLPRIDRFKMRELCVAVIPRRNDLSITSSPLRPRGFI